MPHRTTQHPSFAFPRPLGVRPALPLPVRLRADTRATGSGVCIAMVDSDFVQHADLMLPTPRISAYYDAVNDVEQVLPRSSDIQSRHWHGTMTACTAVGNGYLSQGVFTSLAPNANVVLVRTMNDEGRITTSTIVRALRWISEHARQYNIRVVNISVYADELDHTLDHPVNRAVEDLVADGITVIAAAGNNPWAPIRPPAAAPSAITVGGLDDKNSMEQSISDLYHSTFGVTSLGIQKPDLIAPAVWLPAPILPNTPTHIEASALCAADAMTDDMLVAAAPRLIPLTSLPRRYATERNASVLRTAIAKRLEEELVASAFYKMVDGTSFAAPIIASIVAQMIEIDPSITPSEIRNVLVASALPLATQPLLRQGAGVVRQRNAIAQTRLRLTTV